MTFVTQFKAYTYWLYISNSLGLGSVVDVALASEAEGRGFDPWLDARFLSQHVDSPINWVVTWLWFVVKRLELSQDAI